MAETERAALVPTLGQRLRRSMVAGTALLLLATTAMWVRSWLAADFIIFAVNRQTGITVPIESRLEAVLLRSGNGMFGIGWVRTIIAAYEPGEDVRVVLLRAPMPPVQWVTGRPDSATPAYLEQWQKLGIMFGREQDEYVEREFIENAAIMIWYGWPAALLGMPLMLWAVWRRRLANSERRFEEVAKSSE